MSDIPENEVTQADLFTWYEMQQDLKKLKGRESIMRKRVFSHYFPDPKEGSNSVDLDDGFVLKGNFSITRSVDDGAYRTMLETFREKNINPDKLVNYKPSLVKASYNKLTAEERQMFDQVLVIKPGSSSLTVVLPASEKKDK